MPIDNRATTTWTRAQEVYEHYQHYIESKQDKYALTFTDLVYVKNFKGGMTIISEPVATFSTKIGPYEKALRALAEDECVLKSLGQLDDIEYARVRDAIVTFSGMTRPKQTPIEGFGVSFASALLHFYFPDFVPILDRRALNGSQIPGLNVDPRTKQVVNLFELYVSLIDYFRRRLRKETTLTLRLLDKELFIQKLRAPPFGRKRDHD